MMNLNILIEKKQDGGSIASVLEFPAYRVEAETRDLALTRIQQMIVDRFATTEVMSLKVNLPHEAANDAWIKYAGIFQDDPDFAEMFEATLKSLPDTAKIVEARSKLLPLILKALGIPA